VDDADAGMARRKGCGQVALRLTIETNFVIYGVSRNRFAVEIDELVELARAEVVALALTTAFEVDQERADDVKRARNLEWLRQRPVVTRVPQPGRWDYATWGPGSVFASTELEAIRSEIDRIVLPTHYRVGTVAPDDPEYMRRWRRKVTDVQHLLAHHMSGNDAFVTSDQYDIVKKRDALRSAAGIVVYTFPEAVQRARAANS